MGEIIEKKYMMPNSNEIAKDHYNCYIVDEDLPFEEIFLSFIESHDPNYFE